MSRYRNFNVSPHLNPLPMGERIEVRGYLGIRDTTGEVNLYRVEEEILLPGLFTPIRKGESEFSNRVHGGV